MRDDSSYCVFDDYRRCLFMEAVPHYAFSFLRMDTKIRRIRTIGLLTGFFYLIILSSKSKFLSFSSVYKITLISVNGKCRISIYQEEKYASDEVLFNRRTISFAGELDIIVKLFLLFYYISHDMPGFTGHHFVQNLIQLNILELSLVKCAAALLSEILIYDDSTR